MTIQQLVKTQAERIENLRSFEQDELDLTDDRSEWFVKLLGEEIDRLASLIQLQYIIEAGVKTPE